jgi:hypothetical protein
MPMTALSIFTDVGASLHEPLGQPPPTDVVDGSSPLGAVPPGEQVRRIADDLLLADLEANVCGRIGEESSADVPVGDRRRRKDVQMEPRTAASLPAVLIAARRRVITGVSTLRSTHGRVLRHLDRRSVAA